MIARAHKTVAWAASASAGALCVRSTEVSGGGGRSGSALTSGPVDMSSRVHPSEPSSPTPTTRPGRAGSGAAHAKAESAGIVSASFASRYAAGPGPSKKLAPLTLTPNKSRVHAQIDSLAADEEALHSALHTLSSAKNSGANPKTSLNGAKAKKQWSGLAIGAALVHACTASVASCVCALKPRGCQRRPMRVRARCH